MTLVRNACSALALALLVGACAGGDEEADTTLAMTPAADSMTPAPAPASNAIAFAPVGGATVTGEVEIDGDGAKTEVDVTIRNSVDGAVHQGHIHSGNCAAPGPIVAPLPAITIDGDRDGDADATLDLPTATVMNGQHIVAYHEAGGNPGATILCVAIPARTGT